MMKLVPVAVIAAMAIGCAPTARAITGDEMCDAMHWPMPLPSMVNLPLDHTDSILDCLDFIAIAPDGHVICGERPSQRRAYVEGHRAVPACGHARCPVPEDQLDRGTRPQSAGVATTS